MHRILLTCSHRIDASECKSGQKSAPWTLLMTEHERIVLAKDLPEHGLRAGDVGTVVHVYGDGRAFEVEFVALSGKALAVVTVPSDQTRAVREDEIAHVRAMATTG